MILPDRPEPAEVGELISVCLDGLAPALADPALAAAYAEKICRHAYLITRREQGRLVGAAAFYANDLKTRRAFITMVAVDPAWRGRGIAFDLISRSLDQLAELSFTSVSLKVMKSNGAAFALYRRCGFEVVGEDDAQLELLVSVH
jgi:ribosomal protein S18 acetylase RimI-like enzyme